MPLLQRHHKEIALYQDHIKFDPDFDRYLYCERRGWYEIITARSNGVLVGYIAQWIGGPPHYRSTLWSDNDVFWLDPDYREGTVGIKLFVLMEKRLRERGVSVMTLQPKMHFEKDRGGVHKILDYLGFEATAMVWQKDLTKGK